MHTATGVLKSMCYMRISTTESAFPGCNVTMAPEDIGGHHHRHRHQEQSLLDSFHAVSTVSGFQRLHMINIVELVISTLGKRTLHDTYPFNVFLAHPRLISLKCSDSNSLVDVTPILCRSDK